MIPIPIDSHDALVRELEPPDEPEVQALFAACEDWFVAATGEPAGPADVQSLYYALPAGAEPDTKRLLVVVRDEEIVGLVDAVVHHPTPDACAVGAFLLHPGHRRQGLGSAVATALLERIRRHGVTTVTASCVPGFEPGRAFLAAQGFRVAAPAGPGAGPGPANRNPGPHEPAPLRATLILG